jgi:hypothetical protein
MAERQGKKLPDAIEAGWKVVHAWRHAPAQNHCARASDYGLMLARERPIRGRILPSKLAQDA